ncbi:STM3941 family protein [Adhaeribacter rhizoryzae]|nr:STM3941 family protein [Adhaeribacter rhizoryzae]
MNRIEVPLSKKKILLLVLGSIAFVIFGILFILNPETFVSPIFRNPQILRIIGIAAVIFFSATGIYGFRKLFDQKIGLIVDEHGITDYTNASSVGLIDWADITGIETEEVMSTKFLLIFTINPDKYLERVKGFKRKLMQGNMKMYGTPLAITSTTLNYNFNDLEKLLKNRLLEQKGTSLKNRNNLC